VTPPTTIDDASSAPKDTARTAADTAQAQAISQVTPSAATTTTTVGPAPSPVSAGADTEQVETGTFEGSFDAATYQRASTQAGTISATWDDDATWTLSYSCSTGSSSVSGTSGLELALPQGTCSVTISGPADTPPTGYSLDLGPA
jgi:hypothetical protein